MFKKFIHIQTVEAFPAELAYARVHDSSLPETIVYHGTVKLHGTNVGIRVSPDSTLSAQSRNKVITPEDDNAGFARYLSAFTVQDLYDNFIPGPEPFIIYGEWVGKGIMKGTACSTFPDKRFVAFALGFEDGSLLPAPKMKAPFDNVASVDLVLNIKSDGSNYAHEVAKAMELTAQVDKECPWAKVRGFVGPGEGIVWKPQNIPAESARSLWLKTKGLTHKAKTKVGKKPQEELDQEQQVIAALYEKTDGPTRVVQGIEYLREMGLNHDMKSIATFIQWFNKDFTRECTAQIAEASAASGLDEKMLLKSVSSLAIQEYRAWLISPAP